MRYTKICNPHLRMNFGSWHSLNRSMLSAATRQNLCNHGNLEYPAILPCSYLLADAEIQNTMRKLFIYSKSKVRVLGTVIVPMLSILKNEINLVVVQHQDKLSRGIKNYGQRPMHNWTEWILPFEYVRWVTSAYILGTQRDRQLGKSLIYGKNS